MTRIAFCTTVYDEARPFFPAFVQGLLAAAAGYSSVAVVVSHAMRDAEAALAPLAGRLTTRFATAPASHSPAAARRLMIATALETDADIFVFADCDDALLPDALDSHLDALRGADFSYGDQCLTNADLEPSGQTLYQDWQVPDRAESPECLRDGNFAGFSGAAVHRGSLDQDAATIPGSVIAADWWLFTQLLVEGRTGARTAKPVVLYRQHAENFTGVRPDPAVNAVLKRCAIVRHHSRTFPHLADRAQAVDHLVSAITGGPEAMRQQIEDACARTRMWYADIATLARPYETSGLAQSAGAHG